MCYLCPADQSRKSLFFARLVRRHVTERVVERPPWVGSVAMAGQTRVLPMGEGARFSGAWHDVVWAGDLLFRRHFSSGMEVPLGDGRQAPTPGKADV